MSSPSENDLIRAAVGVLHRRAVAGDGYAGLTPAAAAGLCHTLSGVAEASPELDLVERGEAVCLAHRVLDDDHPEQSPLWPDATDRAAPTVEA